MKRFFSQIAELFQRLASGVGSRLSLAMNNLSILFCAKRMLRETSVLVSTFWVRNPFSFMSGSQRANTPWDRCSFVSTFERLLACFC